MMMSSQPGSPESSSSSLEGGDEESLSGEFEAAMAAEGGKRKASKAEPRQKKKSRALGVSRYLDEMAAEEEDEEDEVEERSKRRKEEEENREFEAELARQDERRRRAPVFAAHRVNDSRAAEEQQEREDHLFGDDDDDDDDERGDSDVAAVAKALERRYAAQEQRSSYYASGDSSSLALPEARQAVAPSLTDPRLWMVRVKPGTEVEACVSLQNRAMHGALSAGGSLGPSSVLWTGLRGHVYIESRTESAARRAIEGLRLFKHHTLKMVPAAEMVAVVSANEVVSSSSATKASGLGGGKNKVLRRRPRVGDLARLKSARGELFSRYKNDLVQVVSLSDDASSAVVKVVPRLATTLTQGGGVLTAMRPPPRLFSAAEVAATGGHVEQRRWFGGSAGRRGASRNWELSDAYFEVCDNQCYRGGFLYKEVSVSTLDLTDPKPLLDELERLVVRVPGDSDEEAPDDDDDDDDQVGEKKKKKNVSMAERARLQAKGVLESLAGSSGEQAWIHIGRGDQVTAVEGSDLAGLPLVVDRLEQTAPGSAPIAYVRHESLGPNPIAIGADALVKRVELGSRVAVIDGRYSGTTGLVLETGQVQGDAVAVLLADSGGGGREITVRVAHCRPTAQASRGETDRLHGYQLHDLVQLPVGSVGMIVAVNSDTFDLLDARGDLRTKIRPAEVAKSLNSESARNVALDSADEHVREKDVVVLLSGGASSRAAEDTATVLRAYRASLWVLPEGATLAAGPAGGVKVVKARKTRVAGARVAASGLADAYMGLGLRTQRDVFSEASFLGGGGGAAGSSFGDEPGGKSSSVYASKSSSGGFRGGGHRAVRDALVGRIVKVCKGQYKGLSGMVKNATSTHVTVELQTRARLVTTPRECVKEVVDHVERANEVEKIARDLAAEQNYSLDTPFLTGATPMLGGAATPSHGAMTPGRGPGPQTPGRTPFLLGASATPGRSQGQTPGRSQGQTPGRSDAAAPAELDDVWRPRQHHANKRDDDDDDNATGASHLGGYNDDKSVVSTHTATSHKSARSARSVGGSRNDQLWCMEGAEALLDERPCVVVSLPRGGRDRLADVRFDDDGASTTRAPIRRLVRVIPRIGDNILVNDNGNHLSARLLEIEDADGIIKLDSGEYKIIVFSAIARASSNAAAAAKNTN